MIPFILASSSPRRLSLLADIGLKPAEVLPADIDETAFDGEKPRDLAVRLAFEKGRAVAALRPDGIILSGDTVVACGRRILHKAETADEVRRCLRLLSGRRHHVYSAVALLVPGQKPLQKISDSRVAFKTLTKNDIEEYIACGEGIGKAGGYAIQGHAARFVRMISGSYSGIVGLPLFEVARMFAKIEERS